MRVFVDKDRLARFWFLAAVAVLIAAAVERIHLARVLKERERVVIVDPAGTFFVSPLLQFQEARELHAQQSTLAAIAFLERNPKGFDHPELLKQMFLKASAGKGAGGMVGGTSRVQGQGAAPESGDREDRLPRNAQRCRPDASQRTADPQRDFSGARIQRSRAVHAQAQDASQSKHG